MKKQIIIALSVTVLLFCAAMAIFNAPRYNLLMEIICISTDGNQRAYDFTTSGVDGRDIRYCFDNRCDTSVTVRLEKIGMFGEYIPVSEQNYEPGTSWSRTYRGGGKNGAKYRIVVTADGHAFEGDLRVAQVT